MINRLVFGLIVFGLVFSQPQAFPESQLHADALWPPTFSALVGPMHLGPMQTPNIFILGWIHATKICVLALRNEVLMWRKFNIDWICA